MRHEQDGLSAAQASGFGPGHFRWIGNAREPWQADVEAGAFAGRAGYANEATVLLDDAIYGRKSEACSLPQSFGGEERLQKVAAGLPVGALARVGRAFRR